MTEKELRSAYIQELVQFGEKTGNSFSSSTLRTYVGPLTAKGEMTGIVKSVPDLMPEDVPSLLALQEKEAISAVVDWWQKGGHERHRKHQTAMKLWITLRGGKEPEMSSSRSKVVRVNLEQPSYGVRLVFLLQAFYDFGWDVPSEERYNELLRILSMDEEFVCGENGLKEHTSAFRKLRKNILFAAQEFEEEVADGLLKMYSPEQMKSVAEKCLLGHGAKLLCDMLNRPVSYEESLFPVLQKLYSAEKSTCGKAFVELVCKVLEDHDPRQLYKHTQQDSERLWDGLWQSDMVWHWLNTVPPNDVATHALLRLPKPKDTELEMRLTVILFCAMRELSVEDGNVRLDEAEEWTQRAMQYMELHWGVLKRGFAQGYVPSWGKPVEADYLEGGAGKCLFRAEELLHLAELALKNPERTEHKQAWGLRLMKAREALRQTELILQKQLDLFMGAADCIQGREGLYALMARQSLYEADSYLQLVQMEVEERSLGDAVHLYICPARLALENGKDALDEMTGEEGELLRREWQRLYKECTEVFFSSKSPVVKRMGVLNGYESELYQQEFGSWKDTFHTQGSAPAVFLPLAPEQLQNGEDHETVYCGTSDSVLGKDERNQESMELTLFQQIASGKTCLMQMNQVVDNRNMLRLLPTPGFRLACREGIITLSCFLEVNDPRKYLIQSLGNLNFEFSSCALFNVSESGELAKEMRSTMLKYLDPYTDTSILDFPLEYREEMEFLTEAYRILFECFQPSDLRRHHQNETLRFPPRTGKYPAPVIEPLNEVIDQRLAALLQEAELGGMGKDPDTIRALQEYAVKWNAFTDRSRYYMAIDSELKQTVTAEQRNHLEKFRKLVHQCYFLSNGRRSSRTVLLTESDPDLICSSDAGLRADKSEATKRLFYQNRKIVSDSNLSWQDICEVAMTVREIDMRDRKIAASRLARKKAAATGLVYNDYGPYTMACGLTPKTSTGTCVEISQADTGEWNEALEFHMKQV